MPDGDGSSGQRLQTDGSGNLSWGTDNSTDPTKLPLTGGTLTGDLTLNAQSDVRFADADSSHYIALQSPGTIASSFTLTLPATDAAVSGYVLASDGSGTLSWVDPGSTSSPTFTGDATLTNDGALVGFSNLNATYTGNTKTLTVTVASKTGAHRYNGSGSSSGYKIGGKESPFITLTPGRTYKFDQADNSNSGHPLRFYLEADKTTAYTTGVTTNGTAGSAGAYTQIVVSDTTPQVLHYQCSAHALMGNSVQTNSNIAATPTQLTVTANNTTDETVYPLFVDGATGAQGAESDTGLTYNPSSGLLTSTGFVGNVTGDVTGNVTGNCSGTAATVTDAAQTAITSVGTLSSLTIAGNLLFTGTGMVDMPVGTTGERPAGANTGAFRYNSTLNQFEGYGNTGWGAIGGAGGGATGGGSDEIFVENSQTITTDYTIGNGSSKNASSVGDLAINSGVTVTVPANARWVVL